MDMTSAGASPGMMVAMMAAMMLPSFAPAVRKYLLITGALRRATSFAVGYTVVWGAIMSCILLMPRSAAASAAVILMTIPFAPCKADPSGGLVDGVRAGAPCALRCAGPMALLMLAGVMDVPIMILMIVANVWVERRSATRTHAAPGR